jgi:hypothetical protein
VRAPPQSLFDTVGKIVQGDHRDAQSCQITKTGAQKCVIQRVKKSGTVVRASWM